MKHIKLLLALSVVLIFSGCAANGIGLKTNFKEANFQVGKTKKAEILDHLGLPQKILKDAEGREHFFYEGSSQLVGLCVGCGHTNQGVGLIPSMINQAEMDQGAEYVFDEKGVLLTKFEAQ